MALTPIQVFLTDIRFVQRDGKKIVIAYRDGETVVITFTGPSTADRFFTENNFVENGGVPWTVAWSAVSVERLPATK